MFETYSTHTPAGHREVRHVFEQRICSEHAEGLKAGAHVAGAILEHRRGRSQVKYCGRVRCQEPPPPVPHDRVEAFRVPVVSATPVQLPRTEAQIADHFSRRLVEILGARSAHRVHHPAAARETSLSSWGPVTKVEDPLRPHGERGENLPAQLGLGWIGVATKRHRVEEVHLRLIIV